MNGEQYTAMSVFNQIAFGKNSVCCTVEELRDIKMRTIDNSLQTAPIQELIN